ncbi:MAG: cytochrome c [Bacteroidales bacterium]|jgi:mono/diheme cytochrome c family protein
MIKKPEHHSSFLFFITVVFLLWGCDRDNNHPGYTYYPDMVDSRAYESYSENPNFPDNSTLREPVEGTVPRGYTPLPYTKDPEDRTLAGKELKNPFEADQTNVERGKVLFERFCLQCHGPKGDGKGLLYTSQLYPFPPASLVNEKVKGIPDGEIFHTITYGYGVMAEHGTIIPPEDRWKIVLYIRQELQKTE